MASLREMLTSTQSMPFETTQVSENVYCVLELDPWGYHPLMYIVVGDEKVLVIDTGCDYGNFYFYIKSIQFVSDRRIIVVNTHNHAAQVDALCASGKSKNYTRLLNSSQHWTVKTYKVTRWLSDGSKILLGPENNPRNVGFSVVSVIWAPGHTPDSIVLYYEADNRLFVGDFFYRFADLEFTYEFTDLKDFEATIRKLLDFCRRIPSDVTSFAIHRQARYSSAKSERDHLCMPQFKHFQRFFYAITAGTHPGTALRIDDAEGWRYETRDRAMRVVFSRVLVEQLEDARNASSENGE